MRVKQVTNLFRDDFLVNCSIRLRIIVMKIALNSMTLLQVSLPSVKRIFSIIYLQNLASIQPRTSPPKISQNVPTLLTLTPIPDRSSSPAPRERAGPGARRRRPPGAAGVARAELPILGKISATFQQNFARFRLYRRRSSQANTRFGAFFKIYQILKLKF